MTTAPDNAISGRAILRVVHQQYTPYRAAMADLDKSVVIIRVEAADGDPPDWRARADASRTSAEQKVKNFTDIGLRPREIVLPQNVNPGRFADEIRQANDDPAVMGIIVQQPVHQRLLTFVHDIDPAKDIDALTGSSAHEVCATAEGIWRVTEPFTRDDPIIAVVGANGFVGRGVVYRLAQHNRTIVPIEYGDNLIRVADADVVISVTGSPDLLGGEHLRPHHRLVVDSGFYPLPGGNGVLSDVRADAAAIAQNITPVPGGIGPIEMAVLVERAIRTELDVPTPPWTYDGPVSYRPRAEARGPGDAARLAALGFTGRTRASSTPPQLPGGPARKPDGQRERGPER